VKQQYLNVDAQFQAAMAKGAKHQRLTIHGLGESISSSYAVLNHKQPEEFVLWRSPDFPNIANIVTKHKKGLTLMTIRLK
jgi:hypothetical protein